MAALISIANADTAAVDDDDDDDGVANLITLTKSQCGDRHAIIFHHHIES